ncbi:MAG: DUF2628 domain-containing protein [Pseudomonadota bacterium]
MANEQNDIFSAPQSDLETNADLSLLDAFIGESNRSFYKERFAKFEQGGGRAGWHWPALFVAAFWLPHRKMWALTLLYWIVLPIVVTIFIAIVGAFSTGLATLLNFLIYTLIWLGFPTIATNVYYQHALRKIEGVRQQFSSPEQQLQEIQRIGGTGIGGYVLAGILIALSVFVVVAAFMAGA